MVVGLRCFRCHTVHSPGPGVFLCPDCGPGGNGTDPGILDVQYRPDGTVPFPDPDIRGIFRYRKLLPIDKPGRILPTGDTPLVPAQALARRFGVESLFLKDERRSATQCLKDRATAIALSLAAAEGKQDLYCASAGNAAISLAGYCAHAGLKAHVFVPFDASPVRLGWLERFGADITVSQGSYDQAFEESEVAGTNAGWYSRNCAFNPYLVEGKKTTAFEIAEQLDWHAPDWVIAPVGDGCTLGAIGKGFRELREIGRTTSVPRLLGVQATGMQPLVRRFLGVEGKDTGETAAASIKVRRPRNGLRLMSELRASNGRMVAATEAEIGRAQRQLGEESGVVAEFTSAATIAALANLAGNESLEGQVVVAVITGGRVD